MEQKYICNYCANRKYGTCDFANVCVAERDRNSVPSHWEPNVYNVNHPTHWKPIEECTKPDTVNHPSHYETGRFECFDVMVEALGVEETKGFCLCNAFKYIYRCKIKHETPVEDIKKAIWYLNKFIELEGKNDEIC